MTKDNKRQDHHKKKHQDPEKEHRPLSGLPPETQDYVKQLIFSKLSPEQQNNVSQWIDNHPDHPGLTTHEVLAILEALEAAGTGDDGNPDVPPPPTTTDPEAPNQYPGQGPGYLNDRLRELERVKHELQQENGWLGTGHKTE